MSDHVPVAKKFDSEVTAFVRLWRERRWLAIILLIVGGGVVTWTVYSNVILAEKVGTLEAENSDLASSLRESERESRGLRELVAPLLARAAHEFPGEEINGSLKKVVARLESNLPENQQVASATITVEVFCDLDEKMASHFMDQGCSVALGKATQALLISNSIDSLGHNVGERTVRYRAVTQVQADDQVVGKKLQTLCETEYLQVEFAVMPEGATVKEGKATIIFNGSLRCELQIPPQKALGRRVFARNIGAILSGAILGEKAAQRGPEDSSADTK